MEAGIATFIDIFELPAAKSFKEFLLKVRIVEVVNDMAEIYSIKKTKAKTLIKDW